MYNVHNVFNKIIFYILYRISIYWNVLAWKEKKKIIVVSHLSPELSVFGNTGYEIQKELIEYFAVLEIAIV